jgi:hypothetical protein
MKGSAAGVDYPVVTVLCPLKQRCFVALSISLGDPVRSRPCSKTRPTRRPRPRMGWRSERCGRGARLVSLRDPSRSEGGFVHSRPRSGILWPNLGGFNALHPASVAQAPLAN